MDGAEVEYRHHVNSLLRKLVDDDLIVLNPDGYVVVPDPDNGGTGTRCIALTSGELAVLRMSGLDGGQP